MSTIAENLEALQQAKADIAAAIVDKGGSINPGDGFSSFAQAIETTIPEPVEPTLVTKNITTNGTYNAQDDNADGYSSVTVDVAAVSKLPQVVDGTITEITAADLAGATSICEAAFKNRQYLTSVTIPNSVTIIDRDAFNNCSRLTSVTIPNSVTTIGNSAFSVCSALPSITIPNSVTRIDPNAFSSCMSLISITIPNGVTSIGNWTFQNCINIASITIPDSVTSIGNSAFQLNGSRLTSVTIPSRVTSIGSLAFAGCTGLTSITILATTPPTLANSNAFPSNVTTIYIPNGTLSAYQGATNWSSFSSKFVELPA